MICFTPRYFILVADKCWHLCARRIFR